MLRLNLTQEADWLDLGHGVEILFAPMTTALMMAARKEAQGQITVPEKVDLSDEGFDTDGIALAMATFGGHLAAPRRGTILGIFLAGYSLSPWAVRGRPDHWN